MILALTFTDGLTVSAIILALVAISSEIAFFIIQTKHLTQSEKEQIRHIGEMREVLGRLEGLTTGTRDHLQVQFDRVLAAAIGGSGEVTTIEKQSDATVKGGGDDSWRRARLETLLKMNPQLRYLLSKVVAGELDFSAELRARAEKPGSTSRQAVLTDVGVLAADMARLSTLGVTSFKRGVVRLADGMEWVPQLLDEASEKAAKTSQEAKEPEEKE